MFVFIFKDFIKKEFTYHNMYPLIKVHNSVVISTVTELCDDQ